ncbi:hypothetical protein RRG08_005245 [Elysia crispata]|uniref:Uncharacterized protein n=1 Tax=Elysia crispata TaxID=231223 RepID=A0AAE0YBH3_9GAST|nr:hypothetical protein RRG08_005245 [Elysia crispata]
MHSGSYITCLILLRPRKSQETLATSVVLLICFASTASDVTVHQTSPCGHLDWNKLSALEETNISSRRSFGGDVT